MLDIAIIGAGPYGLSLGAHAEAKGLRYKVFGYPMDFWKSKMPPNMFIRTLLDYTGLSDPGDKYTLEAFGKEKGLQFSYPLPRSTFVEYGMWFVEKTGVQVEKTYVLKVDQNRERVFTIICESSKIYKAKHVIVAVGLTNAQYIPVNLRDFPKGLVTHSSDHTEFASFKGKRVLVIGGGQSAWEAAALLHEEQAIVDLAYRRARRLSPDINTNKKQQQIAGTFYYLPEEEKEELRRELERPTVSQFLVPLVEGKVLERNKTFISHIKKLGEDKLYIEFNDGSYAVYDHLVAATGFQFKVERLSFLNPLSHNIEVTNHGEPKVNENFESTTKNLYFVGPASTHYHGPTYRFIAGVWRTSKVLLQHLHHNIKEIKSI